MATDTVGFIGLGIMGRPMALNLIRAGYALNVYGRRPEAVEPLAQAGAVSCANVAALAAQSPVIFTMVSDTADVEQVVVGEEGILHSANPGSVVIDMSTVSPVATRIIAARLAEKRIDMLDAPVSGGEHGAIEGALSIMVGGKPGVFEKLKPLFDCLGKNIVHVGDHGAGQVAKACNQVLVAQTMAAVGEALCLARASGVDPVKVREALLGGFAYSKILEVHGQKILDRDFKPGFKARLHQKDMRIVLETAYAQGVALPGGALCAQYLNALVARGDGELDSCAIATVIEGMSEKGEG